MVLLGVVVAATIAVVGLLVAPSSSSGALPPGGRDVTAADGVVPDGVTVFDTRYPAVTRLDPALLRALRSAGTAARRDGVQLDVDSGWRSRAYQRQLFREAVAKYGSAREASEWVARPGSSVHESGKAADIGGPGAAAWLARHGASYGLCRIYRNEPWHVELRATTHGCPTMYADAAHDPRLQR